MLGCVCGTAWVVVWLCVGLFDACLAVWMVDCLINCVFVWLSGCSVGCVFACLVSLGVSVYLFACVLGRLCLCVALCVLGWLAGWLVGWLVGWCVGVLLFGCA